MLLVGVRKLYRGEVIDAMLGGPGLLLGTGNRSNGGGMEFYRGKRVDATGHDATVGVQESHGGRGIETMRGGGGGE